MRYERSPALWGGDGTTWEVKITRDGFPWPWRWAWAVSRTTWKDGHVHLDNRSGLALSKDGARHKAVRARASMERDDVRTEERV